MSKTLTVKLQKYFSLSLRFILPVMFAAVVSIEFVSAQTSGGITSIFGVPSVWDLVNQTVAILVNAVLAIASWFVAFTGMLLNISINVTLHMKSFIDSTPAIYDVWRTIRDVSGMALIFFLLYAAIQLITGIQKPNFGGLIKGIVVAGILINFSFFITGLLIDASNVVSLALYRAIVPGQPDIEQLIREKGKGQGALEAMATVLFNDGGISSIFMQSLNIQGQFSPENLNLNKAQAGVSPAFRIMLIGATGVMIMITVALSFLFASVAFIARLLILVFLLAFSPLWFAAALIPQLKPWTSKMFGHFSAQLLFMPAYLLLMYTALLILTKSNMFNFGDTANLWQGADPGAVIPINFIVLGINSVFVIFMLNVPLLVAASMGAKVPKFLHPDKIGAANLWKRIPSSMGGFVGTRTVGWAGSKADAALAKTKIGNSLSGRGLRAVTTGALAKSKMGAARSFEELKKEKKDIKLKDQAIDRTRAVQLAIDNAKAKITPAKDPSGKPMHVGYYMSKLSTKEKLSMGADKLKDKEVLKYLKNEDFEAIKKPDSDFTDDEKQEISDGRAAAFNDAVADGDKDAVKFMMDNMDGKLLNKMTANLRNPIVIENYKPSQLKTMAEEGLDDAIKREIGRQILAWATPHKSRGFINKNSAEWT